MIDVKTKQIDELLNENAALRSTIDELTGSNATTKQTPMTEPQRVIPITPMNLFTTNLFSACDHLTKQQGKHPVAESNPIG